MSSSKNEKMSVSELRNQIASVNTRSNGRGGGLRERLRQRRGGSNSNSNNFRVKTAPQTVRQEQPEQQTLKLESNKEFPSLRQVTPGRAETHNMGSWSRGINTIIAAKDLPEPKKRTVKAKTQRKYSDEYEDYEDYENYENYETPDIETDKTPDNNDSDWECL